MCQFHIIQQYPFDLLFLVFFEEDGLVRLHLNDLFYFVVGAVAVRHADRELVELEVARHDEVAAYAREVTDDEEALFHLLRLL